MWARFARFFHPLSVEAKDLMHSSQEFWTRSSQGVRNKLLHKRKVHAYIFSTCLTNRSQVQLAKGDKKATCYPVDGPGDFGWCTVEQDVEEVRCLSSKNLPRLWKFDRIGASAATTATSRGFTTIPSWWKQGSIFSSQNSKIFDRISSSA